MTESPKPAPEKIGSYQIVKKLGAGGMGEVLLAYDERLDRHVAVKRVRLQSDAGESDSQERFRREARAAAKLNHPSIVRVYDVFEDDSGQNIVMEYLEGQTVTQIAQGGPMDQMLVIRIGLQVAEALAEAHEQGIVHRDLKGENVMVTGKGIAKILDFGLAREMESEDETLTQSGQMLGTLRSMSPEQARGERVNERTDLFSLGVMLYEMLGPRSPFRGENFLQTLHNVQFITPPSLLEHRSGLAPALARLVEWLLKKDPKNRPFSARQVAQILKRIEEGLDENSKPDANLTQILKELEVKAGMDESGSGSATITSRSNAPTVDQTSPVKKSKTAPILIVAVILVAAGFFVWYQWFRVVEPLRVVITRPVLEGEGRDAQLLAAGVFETTLRSLTNLKHMSPIHPNQIAKKDAGPVAIAKAVGADEILSADIVYDQDFSRITLRRINGLNGATMWSDSFQVPGALINARISAEAVATRIRRAYPGYVTRRGAPEMEVRDQDYAEFMKIARRFGSAEHTFETEMERIDAILEGSPRFLAAYLLAGANALVHFDNNGDQRFLQKAVVYRDGALKIAPQDLRCLRLNFKVLLRQDKRKEAQAVLANLEDLEPLAITTRFFRSELAERNGDLNGAIAIMREAVALRPQWRSLYRLSKLENQAGDVDGARNHLEQLLEIAPGNTWGMMGLANTEMMYGSLDRAESLFLELSRLIPRKSFFANLGTTRFWKGNYDEAILAYIEARELAPGDVGVLVGLADCYMALEKQPEAKALYAMILESLEDKERSTSLKAIETVIKAQCLAYLGEMDQAIELALETLQGNPDHAEIAFQAALVYALAGEIRSVLACAKTALAKGVQPRWFSAPAFNKIRMDDRFIRLMETKGN